MKHVVVLISGKQGSGKSSTADILAERLKEKGLKTHRTRYARVLYMMHDAIRDIGRKYDIPFPDKIGPLLQYLGTEVVRNTYGENSWVNCLKKELSLLEERSFVIIDDCRFNNEVRAFDNSATADVFKVRLDAPVDVRKARTHAWRDNDTHPSETGLDDYKEWDLVINTTSGGPANSVDTILKSLAKWGT